ncbi:TylF/MycF family methyltransferase [Actinomadura viridis]|uniref:Macrocin O-methyltransferase n=1 Tax=Actinomadura viridis TaxID=58110 RepID=A0A931GK80_9ACTN|nr:TylF/MycF/NovP-related O-methyltransferase [Actinomadura viridis]MBG6090558.1 hypothetical protein [Actinomadura viridis]
MTKRATDLYLDLVKRAVTNSIYRDPHIDPQHYYELAMEAGADAGGLTADDPRLWRPYSEEERRQGRCWPRDAHTMVGRERLDHLQECMERVIAEGVPGDVMETGVWRGGVCVFMRAVLSAYGITDRAVWVADSFSGLPEPDVERFPEDRRVGSVGWVNGVVGVPLEQVRENFRRYGLLDGQVRFVEGRFGDSLPAAPVERLAVLRLDGDLYESTYDALEHLHPKVSPGGFVIVDDYHAWDVCAKAVHDYRRAHGIDDPIVDIDWSGVYWRKSS